MSWHGRLLCWTFIFLLQVTYKLMLYAQSRRIHGLTCCYAVSAAVPEPDRVYFW